jgi:flagellin
MTPVRISHNQPALAAYNASNAVQTNLARHAERLSTGLRINSAADDAAGLAVSEKTRSQIRGLDQAARNAQDGISMAKTAEGAMNEIHSILQRMRELSAQAANDTLTAEDRAYIQAETDQLLDEINRISTTTQFNKKKLLDGSASVLWSSDKLKTSVTVKGSVSTMDQFGQSASREGNYELEITANPGVGQVQKSNIMLVAEDKPLEPVERVTSVPTPDCVIDIGAGTDESGASSGTGWNFASNTLTITGGGTYQITGSTTDNHVTVAPGVSANIILSDASIKINNGSYSSTTITFGDAALDITGASVNVYLSGDNTLSSGEGRAGLEAPVGSTLVIEGIADGKLTATGGYDGAGIGGHSNKSYTTPPGLVFPTDGGVDGSAGNITINGGDITANAGVWRGAGIGGGGGGNGGVITINGGTVRASGHPNPGSGGAGIGSGNDGTTGGVITINGGTIYARGGGATSTGGGAGIGGGDRFGTGSSGSDGGIITINGGSGTAVGGWGSAGIGGGCYSTGATVTVMGEWDLGNAEQNIPATITTKDGVFTVSAFVVTPSNPSDKEAKNIGRGYEGSSGSITRGGIDAVFAATPLQLFEMPEFYTETGVFTIQTPQTLTLYQGDGRRASVTLYANDTMESVAKKINDAIARVLGQAIYSDNSENFCALADGTPGTSESAYRSENIEAIYSNPVYDDDGNVVRESEITGYKRKYYSTTLVRSVIPGVGGELTFSGGEDLLKALGLSTIQESRESEYTVSVYDAHSGDLITSPRKISGNVLDGAIDPNIDVKFDIMANTAVTWNERNKRYELTRDSESYSTIVHIADNATILQIGANEEEDMIIDFADMSAAALGIDGLLMISRETAARSLTKIDSAIGLVSRQRAKLGAYQNRLEHTIANLTEASANSAATDSRIRDADLAKEMMEFTKLNLLSQAGMSTMGQANQLPRNVLSLLGKR